MDPISQGIVGTVCALNFKKTTGTNKSLGLRNIAIVGALAGMAPDLDILISSKTDPLLALEFHRHFSHSIAFAPIGALICALVFYYLFFKKRGYAFSSVYLPSFWAYFSHGFLDAFTSYGTQQLWPFSNMRVAWDSMSIIDLSFTLPLILLVLMIKKHSRYIRVSLVYMFVYLSLGLWTHSKAVSAVKAYNHGRGINSSEVQAKPSIGNFLLFRGITRDGEKLFVDAVRVSLFHNSAVIYPGESVVKVDPESLPLAKDSVQLYDVQRFNWFSGDRLFWHPSIANVLGDFRYGALPNSIEPLWGIRVFLDDDTKRVERINTRDVRENAFFDLWSMIKGEDVFGAKTIEY